MLLEKHGSTALIEPHDGEIESILIVHDGTVSVQFAKLSIYHEIATERYEIWVYRAMLEIGGVDRLALNGLSPKGFDDYVDDVAVLSDGGEVVNWNELLDVRPVTQIDITFGSGRTVKIKCRDAKLLLQEAVRHVEDWSGPLYSSPATR